MNDVMVSETQRTHEASMVRMLPLALLAACGGVDEPRDGKPSASLTLLFTGEAGGYLEPCG